MGHNREDTSIAGGYSLLNQTQQMFAESTPHLKRDLSKIEDGLRCVMLASMDASDAKLELLSEGVSKVAAESSTAILDLVSKNNDELGRDAGAMASLTASADQQALTAAQVAYQAKTTKFSAQASSGQTIAQGFMTAGTQITDALPQDQRTAEVIVQAQDDLKRSIATIPAN